MPVIQFIGLLNLHQHSKHDWSTAEYSSKSSLKYLLVHFTTYKYPLKKGKPTKKLVGYH